MLDSDMQHPPELIPELVRRWEDGADIVQTLRQDDLSVSWFKRTTSRWFYEFLMRIGSIDLPVGAADYRLVSSRVARTIREQLPERNPFLRGLISWVGFNVCYVPFATVQRFGGRSKYNLATLLGFALNGIFSFSKFPLRLCIGVGISLAVLSVIFTSVQIVMYLNGSDAVPGWASLFGAVGIIGGIQLLFLGMLGEYLSIIFDEVKQRPRYLISRQTGPANRDSPRLPTALRNRPRISIDEPASGVGARGGRDRPVRVVLCGRHRATARRAAARDRWHAPAGRRRRRIDRQRDDARVAGLRTG